MHLSRHRDKANIKQTWAIEFGKLGDTSSAMMRSYSMFDFIMKAPFKFSGALEL